MIDVQVVDLLHPFQIFNRRILIDLPSGFPRKVSNAAWEFIQQARQGEELAGKIRLGMLGGQPNGMGEDFKPTGIFSALINLTHHCNMACRYCLMGLQPLKEGYLKAPDGMTETTAIKVLDLLHKMGVPSPVSLTFFGGEPLLEFPLMKQMVTYAEARYPGRFLFSMITNGTLLTDETIDFIKEHRVGIVFSIDGNRESNDRLRVFRNGSESVFDKAFGNLKRLLKQVPEVSYKVNVTYFKQTLNLAESFRFFLDQGIAQTRYERGLTDKNSPYAIDSDELKTVREQFSEMAKIYRDALIKGSGHIQDNFVILMKKLSNGIQRYHGCNMGVDYVTIASNGDIYPCHKMIGMTEARMGNVAGGFENSPYEHLWNKNVLSREPCKNCWARFICGGLCASDNYHYNGDFLKPVTKSCEIMRHLIKLSCWLLAELEEKAPEALKRLLGPDYLAVSDIPLRRSDSLDNEDGGMYLRNRETMGEYSLNETAREIFDACNGQNTVENIAAKQASLYGIPMDVALQDTRDTLARMLRNGLVTLPETNGRLLVDAGC